jgi:hypothetical protein
MTLLIMAILIRLNTGEITFKDITYNSFYLLMTPNKLIYVMSQLLMS